MQSTTAMPSTTRRYAGKQYCRRPAGCFSETGAGIGIGSPPQTMRQRSATMNEMPSVTSTVPARFRPGDQNEPLEQAPNAATSTPEKERASQSRQELE